jgi:hypothetical protein
VRLIDMDTPYGRLRITWDTDSLWWVDGRYIEHGSTPPNASLDWQPITVERAGEILTAMLRRETLPDATP